MNLEFTEIGTSGQYEAEATVNADYNLHVEMAKSGQVILSQTTVQGESEAVKAVGSVGADGVFDEDFDAIVYPKYITVKTTALPKKGIITEIS